MALWAAVASPLLVIGMAFLIGGILELLGAECVTYGNNPMHFDNDTVCNGTGDIQSSVGWWAFILAIVLMPVAFTTGAVAGWRAWRATKRRSG